MRKRRPMNTVSLTDGEFSQVQSYIMWAEREGAYYEPKKYFDHRHKEICRAFGLPVNVREETK